MDLVLQARGTVREPIKLSLKLTQGEQYGEGEEEREGHPPHVKFSVYTQNLRALMTHLN